MFPFYWIWMPLDRNVRKVEAFSNVPVFRKFLSVKADHRVLSPVCRLSDPQKDETRHNLWRWLPVIDTAREGVNKIQFNSRIIIQWFFSADLFVYHNIRYENYKLYQVVKEGPSKMPCAITQMVDGRLNIDGGGANVGNQCTLELGNS